MNKIKKFEVVIDDGDSVFKAYIPALSKKDLSVRWGGNGDIIRVKEVPEILPKADTVRQTLEDAGYGQAECDIVYRILSQYVEGTE